MAGIWWWAMRMGIFTCCAWGSRWEGECATTNRVGGANHSRCRECNTCMERLNKYLAHAGIGSRRHCEELIVAGRVSIDGRTIRELATQVEAGQRVAVDGEPIKGEKHV